jgi:hypothetical protein
MLQVRSSASGQINVKETDMVTVVLSIAASFKRPLAITKESRTTNLHLIGKKVCAKLWNSWQTAIAIKTKIASMEL